MATADTGFAAFESTEKPRQDIVVELDAQRRDVYPSRERGNDNREHLGREPVGPVVDGASCCQVEVMNLDFELSQSHDFAGGVAMSRRPRHRSRPQLGRDARPLSLPTCRVIPEPGWIAMLDEPVCREILITIALLEAKTIPSWVAVATGAWPLLAVADQASGVRVIGVIGYTLLFVTWAVSAMSLVGDRQTTRSCLLSRRHDNDG